MILKKFNPYKTIEKTNSDIDPNILTLLSWLILNELKRRWKYYVLLIILIYLYTIILDIYNTINVGILAQ